MQRINGARSHMAVEVTLPNPHQPPNTHDANGFSRYSTAHYSTPAKRKERPPNVGSEGVPWPWTCADADPMHTCMALLYGTLFSVHVCIQYTTAQNSYLIALYSYRLIAPSI